MSALAAAPIIVHDADQASKLEAVASSGACEAGGVVILDFVAVRTAVGERWGLRREDVQCRIEREIARQVPRSTIFFRVSECEYLVSFSHERGPAAQVVAFNIMEDLLTHFLGRCEPQDLVVRSVSAVTPDGVETTPLSRADVEREKLRQERADAPPAAPGALLSTLIEGPAERLTLKLSPQEIVHIASGLGIGTRISIGLHNAGSDRLLSFREEFSLSTSSLLQCNLHALRELRSLMEQSHNPAVFVVPVFLQTMTSSRARALILDEIRQFRAFDQRRLIVELTGIERGTPSSRLMETSWKLRPFCRAVTGRAQLERSALASLTGARLSGVHLSAQDLGASPSQRAAGLLAAGQSARNLAPMVMAVDLPDAEALNICSVAGFTHATLPARPPAPLA